MAYTNAEGRQQLLDELGSAADAIAIAIAALGEAYEALDEGTGDRLEEVLFRPAQAASGRAKRTYAEFAERHGFPPRTFATASAGHASGARGHIDHAVEAVRRADDELAELQDSMLPVEVGDPELRAGLAEVRALVGDVRGRARELIRTLGR
jgi:class 3 adenylate cyclase